MGRERVRMMMKTVCVSVRLPIDLQKESEIKSLFTTHYGKKTSTCGYRLLCLSSPFAQPMKLFVRQQFPLENN